MLSNLPPATPLHRALQEAEAKAEAQAKAKAVDDALNMFGR